jgi:hypothetical protein
VLHTAGLHANRRFRAHPVEALAKPCRTLDHARERVHSVDVHQNITSCMRFNGATVCVSQPGRTASKVLCEKRMRVKSLFGSQQGNQLFALRPRSDFSC